MLTENINIEIFRKLLKLPDLHLLVVDNKFESQKEFRQKLRQEVYEYFDQALENGDFPNLGFESKVEYDFKELLDLNKIPHPQWGGLSISHCPSLGVFITSFINKNLGIDVEEVERIQREPLLRVCIEEEIDSAPSIAHLWTAKEAAFKSFYRLEAPKTLSQINIFDWSQKENTYYHFRYKCCDSSGLNIIGEGLASSFDRLILSICKI